MPFEETTRGCHSKRLIQEDSTNESNCPKNSTNCMANTCQLAGSRMKASGTHTCVRTYEWKKINKNQMIPRVYRLPLDNRTHTHEMRSAEALSWKHSLKRTNVRTRTRSIKAGYWRGCNAFRGWCGGEARKNARNVLLMVEVLEMLEILEWASRRWTLSRFGQPGNQLKPTKTHTQVVLE